MSIQIQKTACPRCLQMGVTNMLANQVGTDYTFCVNAGGQRGPHQFEDTTGLRTELEYAKSAYPDAYAPPQKPERPAGPVAVQIVIDAENKKTIEELCKQPITSGAELKGVLFDAVKSREDIEKEVQKLRATVGVMRNQVQAKGSGSASLGPNQYIVTLPEWSESMIDDYAETEGKTPGEWLNEQITAYLEQFAGQTA